MLREALYSSSLAGSAFKDTVKSEGFQKNKFSSWLKDFLDCFIVRSLVNALNHFLEQKRSPCAQGFEGKPLLPIC